MATSEGPQAAPSVSDNDATAKPRVIPTNQLVILRENELDCDLPTAIQRVRSDAQTSQSRILIVGPEAVPEAGEASALPLPQLPMSIGQVARSGGGHALAAAGARLRPKMESLDCLLREAKHALSELAEATPLGVPVAVERRFRTVRETLEWLQATADDLGSDIDGQCRGFQEVDLADLLTDLRGQVESFFPRLRVNIAPTSSVCWGQSAAVTEGLFLAMVIAAHRIHAEGSVNVEVEQDETHTLIRIFGLGEPVDVRAPEQMDRLREIVVTQHGGRIQPDALGPFGAGLVVALPSQP